MAGEKSNPTDAAEDDFVEDGAIPSSVESAANEVADLNDRLLRLQAEMQNLRNRTSREISDERKYAAMPVLRDLLPVLDNIGRAIEATGSNCRGLL